LEKIVKKVRKESKERVGAKNSRKKRRGVKK
jgi:hypothetical protein